MDLNSLFEEKNVIEEKIKKLEQMKDQIKDVVYNKIKNEYLEKLNDVNNAIKNNKQAVEQEIESIHNEKESLEKVIEQYENEKQEIEVRIQLGDLKAEEYNDKIAELDNEINQSKLRIDELNLKLQEYENLFDQEQLSEEKQDLEIPSSTKELNLQEENTVQDSPLNDILQPSLDEQTEQESDNDELDMTKAFEKTLDAMKFESEKSDDSQYNIEEEGIENIDADIEKFIHTESTEKREIQGLKCPKCGYINKPELFNCEKCGSELFD